MKLIREGQALYAFRDAKTSVESVAKGETADMGKYIVKYASLNAVHAECERACELHKLVVVQEPTIMQIEDGPPLFAVINTLIHEDGSMLVFEPVCLPHPKDAQALGSAITYLRRYSLVAHFGLAVVDDDGKEATDAARTQPGRRTEAERMIRESIGRMDADTQKQFQVAFKEEFKVGLTDLPAPRHGEALTWSREWERARTEQAQRDAEQAKADEEFVAAAKAEKPPLGNKDDLDAEDKQ